MGKNTPTLVSPVGYGLYLSDTSIFAPPQGLDDCLNVRVKNKAITSYAMGWEKFTTQTLDGAITLIDTFFKSDGSSVQIAGTKTSLYQYSTGSETWLYINPIYNTGTVATTASSATIVGTGTTWTTNTKIGDYIYVGSSAQYDPTATGTAPNGWYTITEVTDNTHVKVTPTPSATASGRNYTISKTFSGTIYQFWVTETFPNSDISSSFADRWFATNSGADYPVYWNGTDNTVTSASGLAFKCKSLKRFKNMMLYLNCVEDGGAQKPMSFKNSDVGKPTTMSGGLAGEFLIGPGTAQILTAALLGDECAIYTENEVVMLSFVGTPTIFSYRTAVTGTGILAGRLLADFADHHQFLARDGLYEFNGVQAQTVDDHVWRGVIQQIDANRIRLSHVTFDEENGDLLWAITLAADSGVNSDGGPDYAFVQHYLEDMPQGVMTPYTKREFPFYCGGFYTNTSTVTWASLTKTWAEYSFSWDDRLFSGAFPIVQMGNGSGIIYKLSTADTHDGVGYQSFALFPIRAMGDMRHRNLIRRVYPLVRQVTGDAYDLTTTVTMYDQEGVATSTTALDFDLSLAGNHFVSPFRRGRFFQVKFGTDGSDTGQPWELHGYDIDVTQGGMR